MLISLAIFLGKLIDLERKNNFKVDLERKNNVKVYWADCVPLLLQIKI